jgi:hypothetical protein
MVADFWSEITQDKFVKNEEWFYVQKRRNITSIRTFLVVLFFLAAGGATRGRASLLSEVELIRFGFDVAYLDIS